MQNKNWQQSLLSIFQLRQSDHDPSATSINDEVGFSAESQQTEPQSPNLRGLRLALTMSDTLLSMGVAASSVVSRTLDVTDNYCDKPVHVDISANLIVLSQLRSLEEEPLTLIRPTVSRDVNNMTIQLIQDLAWRIREDKISLMKAELELDQILRNPIHYPTWMPGVARAGLAAGVILMFTTNWRVVMFTFLIVLMVDQLLTLMSRRAFSPFFQQAAAGAFVTLAAALVTWIGYHDINFFEGISPTYIVVGGIIMMVSGMMIVGGVLDAIDEFYVTANARILKVIMQTTGLVMGILLGIYAANGLGMGVYIASDPLALTPLPFQIAGGVIASGTFAIITQTRMRAVALAGVVGGLALAIMYIARQFDISVVPATGIAALFIGLSAKFLSRKWHTPSSSVISAGIIPLVPGLSLYSGLMQLVEYPPGDPLFLNGIATLFTAIGIAIAIAAGVSFGWTFIRPLHQRHAHKRNFMPFSSFTRAQLKAGHRSRFESFNLFRKKTPTGRWPVDDTDSQAK